MGLSRKVPYASMLLVILQTGYYDDGVTNCDSIDNDLRLCFHILEANSHIERVGSAVLLEKYFVS